MLDLAKQGIARGINVSKKVVLYKNECFYNAYGSDAIFISKLISYKCNGAGFPSWALVKVREN